MRPDRWQRIEALLDSALDLPTGDRVAYLERECGGDAELFREVSAILEAGQRSDPVLDASAVRLGAPLLPNDVAPAIAPPERVGPYRIQRLIGEGGMGSVYLAQRDDGQFRQRVALKLVRRGLHLDSRIVRRFRDERQILATLNHPGIARLLDGGLTDDGLPFFAMEYVEGAPIDRYCDAHGLSVEQRLELFARVCDALAHAHGKQIVHRDIKPSNILVTESGEPRLLDFGIAKLLGPDEGASDPSAITRRSERLLTPEYASPEQIRGEPVVVASDVYCLGVLLYEVLTGQLPFRRAERTPFELERAVLEEDPTRPSEIVQREPLRRRLRGDLDAIILTAMNKEPERRFATAAEMAADVRRHLAGEPVRARGASRVYRARRWAVRHRLVLGSTLVVALATTVIATAVVRGSAPRRLVPGGAHRIAFEPEFALDAEVSPDGRRVAFVAGTGTAMRLYVTNADGEHAMPLGATVPGFHRWPRWSPDGRHIALAAGSRIYDVPADSAGASRVLVAPDSDAGYVAFPAWSPDGAEIAYVQDGAVMVRAAAGGAARRLTSAPGTPHSLEWSPDGTMIALVSGNSEFAVGTYPWVSFANLGNAGPSAIWVLSTRGGDATRITEGTALNTSPVWMPDHHALLYISNRDGARDVYRVELDKRGRPTGMPQRVTTGLGAHTISISRDGRIMAYTNFRIVANVWSVTKAEGGERPTVEGTPVTRGTQSVEGLALSPDGRWLAFDSDRNGNHHIFTIPADGGEARQVTTGAMDEFMPHWSPDAKQIAFHAFTRDLARRLEVVSVEGGSREPLTKAPRNQRRPAWSPDGRAMVFDAGGNTASDVYLIERTPEGGWTAARRLTSGSSARWSPDGRSILYVQPDGIWVTTREGGAGRQVLQVDPSAQPRLGNAEWSPDGATIFFKRYDGEGRTSFWSVPAVGGDARLVVRLDRELRSQRPEFATDGRRFFFTVTERVSDIWTMDLRQVR
jgi:Tol biopolymer transport system component/tRNA A-37 threonylcarbamoyl transferase component Bud32